MPEPAFKSATLVLGVHRSGTSALAGALRLCGLTAPNTLVAANDANSRGFWESQPIKSFNDEILGSLGLSWHSLDAIKPAMLNGNKVHRRGKSAAKILGKEFPSGSDIVIKEPRICRLLPLWSPIVQDSAEGLASAFIIRSPAQVARSLSRRNQLELHHGMLLWLRYMLDAELHTRGTNRSFTSYADLVGDPAAAIGRLANELDLPINPNAAALAATCEYLTTDLSGERPFEEEPLSNDMAVIAEAYRTFDRWARGENETESDYRDLDHHRDELDRMSAGVASIAESARLDRKRTAAARAEAQDAAAYLVRAQESLAQLDDLKGRIADQSQLIASLVEKTQSLERLEDVWAELAEQGGSLRRLVDEVGSSSPEHVRLALEKDLVGLDTKVRSRIAKFASQVVSLGELQRSGFAALESSVKNVGAALADKLRRDEETADGITALAASHGFILEGVEASIGTIIATGREQSALLSRLSVMLEERRGLEEALADALRAAANATARRDQAEAETARAAEEHASERERRIVEQNEAADAHSRERDRLIAERNEAAEEHERDRELLTARHKAALGAQEKLVVQARERIEALERELNRTKRKYRAAQFDAERERKAHGATQAALGEAESKLSQYESSVGWRASVAFSAWSRRVSDAARQAAALTGKRRKEQLQTILQSGLFERDWYLAAYPDVASAGIDPLTHFYEFGWREGRDPGPNFATSAYLKANADVARAGINPLVHFIEFGRSEGRELRVGGRPVQASPIVHSFADAAPVFSGERGAESPVRWLRSYRLSTSDERLLSVADLAVGYAADLQIRSSINKAFRQLAHLSGFGDCSSGRLATSSDYCSAKLKDAWHVNEATLRTRWSDERLPLVLRAFQHDPMAEGQLRLVGEGLGRSELDFVDVSLANPYFPVLFIFAEPDGILRGTRLLAFPSLCRGGLHYPELLAISAEAPDPLEVGLAEAVRLEEARNRKGRLIESISVDISGADGTSPLFIPAFQAWLERVACLSIAASDEREHDVFKPLKGGKGPAGKSGNSLLLAANMAPTIRILGECEGDSGASFERPYLPLLIAGTGASQPATLVELPPSSPSILAKGAMDSPSAWPRIIGSPDVKLPDGPGAAAIRIPSGRELADSELAVPTMGAALRFRSNVEPVTWLIVPSEWAVKALIESITALSLQTGADSQLIAFVGDTDPEASELAERLFSNRARKFPDLAGAAKAAGTPLIGYLGPGVILHDSRSTAVLTEFFSDPQITSVACPLVAAEKRGKSWNFAVADAGVVGAEEQTIRALAGAHGTAEKLWGSSYPVSIPPRDFWVARTASVRSWLRHRRPLRLREGMHICTSLITASYAAARNETSEGIPVPASTAGQTMKTEALFG